MVLCIMPDQDLIRFAEERIKSYDEQIASSHKAIARVDGGMKFYEAVGDEPMREVTSDYRASTLTHIAVLNDARTMWLKQLERAKAS